MFTGIVEETGRVISVQPEKLVFSASTVLQGLEQGGSIAVNGVCLTATAFDASSFTVNIMQETLKRSNLGLLRPGDEVNLERPLTMSKPLGGHMVQGHVDGTGKIVSISHGGGASVIRIEAPHEVMRYIVEKGFIAVDGISLTVVDYDATGFRVSIVSFTGQHTLLGKRRIGDIVNLEVDIIAKYVEKFSQAGGRSVTPDFLKEHGFMVT